MRSGDRSEFEIRTFKTPIDLPPPKKRVCSGTTGWMWAAVEGAEGRFSRPPNAMEGVSWSPERDLRDLDKSGARLTGQ